MGVLSVFISSPGDVAEERYLTRRVIQRLNHEFAQDLRILPFYWEHEPLLASDSYQIQINEIKRPSDCDVMVCILWARLGTRMTSEHRRADGSLYESGTAFEFEDALEGRRKTGRPDLLVYRKTAPPRCENWSDEDRAAHLDQRERLERYLERWFGGQDGEEVLVSSLRRFEGPLEFEELFEIQLRLIIEQRLAGRRRARRGRALLSWTSGSPFRGLEPFEEAHAAVFCGREAAVAEIVEAVRRQRDRGCGFVMVLGASGCGKSSLVRAGVIPLLNQPGIVEGFGQWIPAVLRPSADPAGWEAGLAGCVRRSLPGLADLAGSYSADPASAAEAIESELRAGDGPGEDGRRGLVIAIDPFEEIFTGADFTGEERLSFVRAVATLSRSCRILVLGTLRSDFSSRCETIPELVSLMSGPGLHHLLPPNRAELARMIREPAVMAGLRFEVDETTGQRLDEHLLEAAAEEPGGLPLVEFALQELYRRRDDDGVLTFASLREIGGVAGAVAHCAESALTSGPPGIRDAFDRVVRRLATPAADGSGRFLRRWADLAEIGAREEDRKLLDLLIASRLVMIDSEAGEGARVAITHEALFARWPRLESSLRADAGFLEFRAWLEAEENRWREAGRKASWLIHGGVPLAEAERWLGERFGDLNGRAIAFIDESGREARRRSQRTLRLARLAVVVLLIAAVGSGIGAYFGISGQVLARAEAEGVMRSLVKADLNASIRLLAAGRSLTHDRATEEALSKSNEAIAYLARALRHAPENNPARARLQSLLSQRNWALPVRGPTPSRGALRSSSLTPDGRGFLSIQPDGTLLLRDLDTHEAYGPVIVDEAPIADAWFLPVHGRLITLSEIGAFRFRDASSAEILGPDLVHPGTIEEVKFSPLGAVMVQGADGIVRTEPGREGSCFATRTGSNRIQVWDGLTGQALGPPIEESDGIAAWTLSRDGRNLVSATPEGTWSTWRVSDGSRISGPYAAPAKIGSLALDGSGNLVATGDEAGHVRIHFFATGQLWKELRGQAGPVEELLFARENWRLIARTAASTLAVMYPFSNGPMGRDVEPGGILEDFEIEASGIRLATATRDGSVRIWKAGALDHFIAAMGDVFIGAAGEPVSEPMLHPERVLAVAFDRSGERLLTQTPTGISTWDTRRGSALAATWAEELRALPIISVQFSPDGRDLVVLRGGRSLSVPSLVEDGQLSVAGGWFLERREARRLELVGEAERFRTKPEWYPPDVPGRFGLLAAGGRLQVREMATLRSTGELEFDGELSGVFFGPGFRQAVVVTRVGEKVAPDYIARVWDLSSGKAIGKPCSLLKPIRMARLNSTGEALLAVTGESGGEECQVFDVTTGVSRFSAIPANADAREPKAAAISSDGSVFAILDQKGFSQGEMRESARVRFFNASTGALLPEIGPDLAFSGEDVSADGRELVSKELIVDLGTGAPFPDLERELTVTRMTKTELYKLSQSHLKDWGLVAMFSGSINSIYQKMNDRPLLFWDKGTGLPLTDLHNSRGGFLATNDFGIDADGRYLVCGNDDGSLRLYDLPAVLATPVTGPFLELAEAIGGYRLDDSGRFEPVPERDEKLDRLRRVFSEGDGGDVAHFARWILADRSSRTIGPYLETTVPEFIEDLADSEDALARFDCASLPISRFDLARGELNRKLGGLPFLNEDRARLFLEEDPEDAWRHFVYASALRWNNETLNRLPDALASVERALDLKADDGRFHEERLVILRMLGRESELIEAASEALTLQAEKAEWLAYRAGARARMGDGEAARADFGTLLAMEPEEERWRRDFGWALIGLDDPAGALEQWREAERIAGHATMELLAEQIIACQLAGDREALVANFARLEQSSKDDPFPTSWLSKKWNPEQHTFWGKAAAEDDSPGIVKARAAFLAARETAREELAKLQPRPAWLRAAFE